MAKRFEISGVLGSSAKFGPCEVCGQHATEVRRLTEAESYDGGGRTGWLEAGDLFGHDKCLSGVVARREA